MLLIGVFPSGHVEADEASQEGDDFIASSIFVFLEGDALVEGLCADRPHEDDY